MQRESLVTARHSVSRRVAMVADEGDSVWLYLTAADGTTVVADCWLANRVPAPSYQDLQQSAQDYRARGEPPPAIREVVAEHATRAAAGADPLELRWAADGHSVAAMHGAALVGFIARGEEHGYSRDLREHSPWGAPLDELLFHRLFDIVL